MENNFLHSTCFYFYIRRDAITRREPFLTLLLRNQKTGEIKYIYIHLHKLFTNYKKYALLFSFVGVLSKNKQILLFQDIKYLADLWFTEIGW